MATYDDKGVKGAQLKSIAQQLATKIKTKQDTLDIEYDAANARLIFNNVEISTPE